MVGVAGQVDEEHGAVGEVVDDGFEASVVEEVGDGEAAAGARFGEGWAGGFADVFELAVAQIAVEEAGFAVGGAEFGGVDFGVDVAVDDQEVGPAVVVDVGEHGSPAEGVGVDAETGGEGGVGEGAVGIVAVEGCGVVGEVGLEEVDAAVSVVVGGGGAHAGLLAAVFVEGDSGFGSDVGEGAVFVVAIEDGGGGVAGDVKIWPSVVVVVEGGDGEAVVGGGFFEAALCADVFEFASAEVVEELVGGVGEASGAAHDGDTLPGAGGRFAGGGGFWRGRSGRKWRWRGRVCRRGRSRGRRSRCPIPCRFRRLRLARRPP